MIAGIPRLKPGDRVRLAEPSPMPDVLADKGEVIEGPHGVFGNVTVRWDGETVLAKIHPSKPFLETGGAR